MPVKLDIKFGSKVFKARERTRIITKGLGRKAKLFKRFTVQAMEDGPQTGRLYRRRSGPGFTRMHRASKRHQHPAVDTGNLIRNVDDKRISSTAWRVFIDDSKVPYASPLQDGMAREIITGKSMDRFQRTDGKDEDKRIMEELLG